MSDLPRGIRRVFQLARRRAPIERDVDDEIAFHIEMRAAELVARGMTPEAARAEALRRFGDTEHWSRAMSDVDREMAGRKQRTEWLADLQQDVRYGIRFALRAPLFSFLAVVTLALGVGANAAVFGVVKSVLLDALPYADAGRLVRVHARKNDGTNDRLTLSVGQVGDIAQRVRSFTRVGVFFPMKQEVAYAHADGARSLSAGLAGAGFFQTLGVTPALGRALRDEDSAPGAPDVVVLSHAAWLRLFAGDSTVIGRPMRLNGTTCAIVGVLPADFVGPIGEIDAWLGLDLSATARDPLRVRRRSFLGLVARLRPGATMESARREIATLSADLAREHPDQGDALVTLNAVPLRDDLVGDTRTPLLVLLASAGLVLVITCANLAGALLSRTISRRKEFAVRVALGAGAGRLTRQLLAESTLLSITGGLVGVGLAASALALLRGLALRALPPYANLSLDTGALVVTSLLALATGIAFGIVPALAAGRVDPQGTLREETRGTSESRRSRQLRGLLVAGQIALCVSLVAGAGLLARSLWAITSAPLGIQPDGVLTASLQLPPARYATAAARVRLHEQLEERLRALPGVSGVAFTSSTPGDVQSREGFTIEGAAPVSEADRPFVLYASASDEYFRTMRIPLVSGRTFAPTDRADAPPVIVISESMARKYWPRGDAIGSRIRLGPDPAAPLNEIIGIVGDVRNGPAQLSPEPMAYASSRQDPWGDVLLVRAKGDPLAMLKPVQRELASLDPELPLHDPTTLSAIVDQSLAGRRLPVLLMTAFGALALLLASVGIYAMFAAMGAAREQEFGIRMALGSSRAEIARLVLRQGGVWMAIGLAGGAIGVVFVARLLRNLLYGVPPFDPIALGASAATLLVCAAIALLVPVRRAMRVEPIAALR